MPTEQEISSALKTLTEVGFENSRQFHQQAADAHPDFATPEASALKNAAPVRYDAIVEYDGGDYVADVNVELYVNGKMVGRITCTCASLGPGKYRRNGFAMLSAPVQTFKNWRVSCGVNSARDKIAVEWRGVWFEYVGYANAAPIPAQGLTTGAGKVEVF